MQCKQTGFVCTHNCANNHCRLQKVERTQHPGISVEHPFGEEFAALDATIEELAQWPRGGAGSVETTLAERGNTHGPVNAQALAARQLKDVISTHTNGGRDGRFNDVQLEALDMIALKLSRIIVGDPGHADHWHDIAGYAKLAEDSI
jgi:hypothetical protein